VLNAAAACPIFDRRSVHYLQPPAPLAFSLSPRALELASLQPWCRDNTQRAQLLCSCCPLSTLAFRLPRAVNRCEGSRSLELRATAHIMKHCFSVLALRLWAGSAENDVNTSAHSRHFPDVLLQSMRRCSMM
jgi:hypothetical protein